jgi:hypothetical protein
VVGNGRQNPEKAWSFLERSSSMFNEPNCFMTAALECNYWGQEWQSLRKSPARRDTFFHGSRSDPVSRVLPVVSDTKLFGPARAVVAVMPRTPS